MLTPALRTLLGGLLVFGLGSGVGSGVAYLLWSREAAIHEAESVRQLDSIARVHAGVMLRMQTRLAEERALTEAAERDAARHRFRAERYAAQDHAQDSLLASSRTATDSLPIVVQQRDASRLAYLSLRESADSLLSANASLHRQVALGDSIRSADSVVAAAREAALTATNTRLRVDLARAKSGGKLLGFLPRPRCVVGPTLSLRGPSYVGATCGLAL